METYTSAVLAFQNSCGPGRLGRLQCRICQEVDAAAQETSTERSAAALQTNAQQNDTTDMLTGLSTFQGIRMIRHHVRFSSSPLSDYSNKAFIITVRDKDEQS